MTQGFTPIKVFIVLPVINLFINTNSMSKTTYQNHKIGDEYQMDGKPDKWKIAYYPILEDGKTGEIYEEPRALVEKPIPGGTDFREVPLRYLTKINKDNG
jgi:hypothetical protein